MELIENRQYLNMIDRLHSDFPYWDKLRGKTLFLSGAAGMIGSFLVDALMLYNRKMPSEEQCRIIAASRNRDTAGRRFGTWMGSSSFVFVQYDVSTPLVELTWEPDFWIHAASTTHPVAYATEPVNTILSNLLGTYHLLEAAAKKTGSRFLLLSSVEVYGQNRGDTEYFTEDYCGYLDCNTLRAGYPEGKRVSEALCQAFIQQHQVDALTIRLPRCYGPTMRMSDSKAIAQFIKKAVSGEDIVLKSRGEQLYSYTHTFDAVLGILWVLSTGQTGQVYNLGDRYSDITLKELSSIMAEHVGKRVVFELPDEVEKQGYSTASKALLNAEKLQRLGWKARYNITEGICETIDILRELNRQTV